MKGILRGMAAMTLALMCALAASAPAEGCGERLGYEVLRACAQETGNAVVSPAGLTTALGMAAAGARGETLRELLGALDASDAAQAAPGELPEGIVTADAAFAAERFKPLEAYAADLAETFGAQWFTAGGGFLADVNAWTEEKTGGLIGSLLDEEPGPDAMLVLVDGISLEARWSEGFDPLDTAGGIFAAPDGEKEVMFMHAGLSQASCGERDGAQLLRLDYDGTPLCMYLALPGESGVEGVLDGLCGEGLSWFDPAEKGSADVDLSMPKADISFDLDAGPVLRKLGIVRAFGYEAEFGGVSDASDLMLGLVKQKTRVIIDEEGTRAAAATAVVMIEKSAMIEPAPRVAFVLDRPFVFVIADPEAGRTWFAGVVNDPTAN